MAWPAKQTKQKTLVIGFWALPDNPGGGHLEILNSVTTAKTLFQIKSQPEVPGVGLWTLSLGATVQTTADIYRKPSAYLALLC